MKENENLHAENFALRMQLESFYPCSFVIDENIPASIENEFLKNLEDDRKKKYLSEILSDGRKLYDLLMNKQSLFSEVLV